jgi:type IV pilus assembly protein PilX
VVVLILLVAMSLLGIAIMRSTAMQERMSANLRDRSLAFQAAEATMRFAQNQVLGAVPTDPTLPAWDTKVPTLADCTASSICPTGSAAIWRTGPSYGTSPATTTEYWIEYVGTAPARPNACSMPGKEDTPDCQSPMYRVSVRSRAAGRADVMLQGNIISRIPEPGA